jgi:hypothetical protein
MHGSKDSMWRVTEEIFWEVNGARPKSCSTLHTSFDIDGASQFANKCIACWCTGTAASEDTINSLWSQKLWNVHRHATPPSGILAFWADNFFTFGQRVNHHWLSPAGATITRVRYQHPSSRSKAKQKQPSDLGKKNEMKTSNNLPRKGKRWEAQARNFSWLTTVHERVN